MNRYEGRAAGATITRPPYCRRIPRRSMPVLQAMYASPGRTVKVDGSDSSGMFAELVSHGLAVKHDGDYYSITVPGSVYCIAREYGISFAYMVYLAYLYSESRDPAYALQVAGGDVELAKKMVCGEAEYPYGILYHPNAGKKFEAVNRFVLGTFIEEKGHYVNGIVTDVARHELSRKGIVRHAPGHILMFNNSVYSNMTKKYDRDMHMIVAWADDLCNTKTLLSSTPPSLS